jgi:hypothetical protein
MTTLNPAEIKARLKTLGLFGLLACCDEIADKPWLPEVLAIEERERQKRSLERRLRNSRVAAFKPMADFDWAGPRRSTARPSTSSSHSASPRPATMPSSSVPTASAKQ